MWETNTFTKTRFWELKDSRVNTMVAGPKPSTVAIGTGGAVLVLNLEDGHTKRFDGGATEVSWSGDGRFLVSLSGNTITVFDCQEWKSIRSLHAMGATGIALSEDATWLFCGTTQQGLLAWRLRN